MWKEYRVTYHNTESDVMALSEKKKAAFASLIARQRERQNESLDGRTNREGGNTGDGTSERAEIEPGANRITGGTASSPTLGGDPTNSGAEPHSVGAPGRNLGGSEEHGPEASSREDTGGAESRTSPRIARRQRSELPPEERNFTIEPGIEPQPSGRRNRLDGNLKALKLLKLLEIEDRPATQEEKEVLAKFNGFGADKEVLNSGQAQYRTWANRDDYEFYAGRKVYALKEGLDAAALYSLLQPLLYGVSSEEFAEELNKIDARLAEQAENGPVVPPRGGKEKPEAALRNLRIVTYLVNKLQVEEKELYTQLEWRLKESSPFVVVRREGGWENNYGRWYDAFREVLTEEEWEDASRASLNAHYTPAGICHQLWDLAQRAGFRGGKVFEPGCGVGNFMGSMPEGLREGSSVSGVELDSLSARIAAKLYPENRIELSAIEDAVMVGDNTQDLVIGNVPFSDTAPSGQRGSVKLNLHNFCISKSIDKLRPGGLAILITSHSTLDHNDLQRDELANKAELVAAVRLPNDAFFRNANTEVVADILVLRKPSGLGHGLAAEQWRQVEPIEVAEREASENGNRLVNINEYFIRHPEMMLGEASLRGKMHGHDARGQFTVKRRARRSAPV